MKALMIDHSYCPVEPRVRREVEALRGEGIGVDVVCLRNEGEHRCVMVSGVSVQRLPINRH